MIHVNDPAEHEALEKFVGVEIDQIVAVVEGSFAVDAIHAVLRGQASSRLLYGYEKIEAHEKVGADDDAVGDPVHEFPE